MNENSAWLVVGAQDVDEALDVLGGSAVHAADGAAVEGKGSDVVGSEGLDKVGGRDRVDVCDELAGNLVQGAEGEGGHGGVHPLPEQVLPGHPLRLVDVVVNGGEVAKNPGDPRFFKRRGLLVLILIEDIIICVSFNVVVGDSIIANNVGDGVRDASFRVLKDGMGLGPAVFVDPLGFVNKGEPHHLTVRHGDALHLSTPLVD